MATKGAVSQQLASEAQHKLAEFKAQQRRQLILNVLGYSGLCVVAFFFVVLVGGDRFAPILNFLGIEGFYHEERGIYADCSKPENRYNPFCSRGASESDKAWGDLRNGGSMRSVPFTLSR